MIIPKLENETRNLKKKLQLKSSILDFSNTCSSSSSLVNYFDRFSTKTPKPLNNTLKLNQQQNIIRKTTTTTPTPINKDKRNYLLLLNESFDNKINKENNTSIELNNKDDVDDHQYAFDNTSNREFTF